MCGITGYIGPREAAPIIVDSLKRLEYRGYDSCGIGILNDGDVYLERRVGRIDPFREAVLKAAPPGHVGLGHTRWATHGKADLKNAHPHVSCDGSILAVHNGTLDNYELLREQLEEQGHKFSSHTDSEVVPHLVEESLKRGKSLDEAVVALRGALRGQYALLIARKGTEELYALRRGSPLVIGVGVGEYFPASDIPSFLPLTKRVIYLAESNDVVLTRGGIFQLEATGTEVNRANGCHVPSTISLDASNVSKGDFDHYMIKEILDQVGVLEEASRQNLEPIWRAGEFLRASKDIWLVGSGSSYHACFYGDYLLSTLTRKNVRAQIASELEFRQDHIRPESVVVAVSQSGETADVVNAVGRAIERGARVIAITASPLSQLARMASVVVPLECGTELSVAATKSYTAQLTVFLRLAYHLKHNDAEGAQAIWRARDGLLNLTSAAAREHTVSLAHALSSSKSIFLVGRGLSRVTAMESALKLKEVAGIHAEAFPGGEMKHGPLALVEEGTPVVFFFDNTGRAKSEVAASEVQSRGGVPFSVGPCPLRASADHIRVEDASMATPIVQVVPMQLLSYELALLKGLDPDHPRNLAKAVTVA